MGAYRLKLDDPLGWRPFIFIIMLLLAGFPLIGCGAGTQVHSKGSHQTLSLEPGDLEAYGLALANECFSLSNSERTY